ncbi:1-deoxy-D-xylulose-5-phosphate synthase N-terminal domain-containing protein [Pseudomonas lini]
MAWSIWSSIACTEYRFSERTGTTFKERNRACSNYSRPSTAPLICEHCISPPSAHSWTKCGRSFCRASRKTGGHLSANLGTVELSIALHYVFDTPQRQGRVGCRPSDLRPQNPHRPT